MWECIERLDNPGRPWVAVPRCLVAARLGRDGIPPNLFEKRLFDVLERAGRRLGNELVYAWNTGR